MDIRKYISIGFFAMVPIIVGASGVYITDYASQYAGTAIEHVITREESPINLASVFNAIDVADTLVDSEPRNTIQIGWVGDIAPYRAGVVPELHLFENISPLLKLPDIMIGNLEGALIPEFPLAYNKCGRVTTGCYQFVGDTQFSAHLFEAGFDALNIANNHTNDAGPNGSQTTARILETNAMLPFGLQNQIAYQQYKKTTIAYIGVSPFSGTTPMDDATVTRLVQTADETADIIVVAFHGGKEGPTETIVSDRDEYAPSGQYRGNMYRMAHTAIDAGADIVLGSGPHVLRGIEVYKDRLIAYSLANFAANKSFNMDGDLALSGILFVNIDETTGSFVSGNFVSVILEHPGKPTLDIENRAFSKIKEFSLRDFPTSPIAFDRDGTIEIVYK